MAKQTNTAREMQFNITMNHHFIAVRVTIIKKQKDWISTKKKYLDGGGGGLLVGPFGQHVALLKHRSAFIHR